MNYKETLDFLYQQLPMFQRQGATAFKKDLTNTLNLCDALGNPQEKFKSVHIAGTNGKGSCSHMIAAVMQSAGFKVGLYTSPHLKSFRERIKVNGQEIAEQDVVDFVAKHQDMIEDVSPSFFELTVAMAFDYFAQEAVDIAIVEVGLGGRLDSTNVLSPMATMITNIGLDHQGMLGETLEEIAAEKAGIIKKEVPVIIGRKQEALIPVFEKIAEEKNAGLVYPSDYWQLKEQGGLYVISSEQDGISFAVAPQLKGSYQKENILAVLEMVLSLKSMGWHIELGDIVAGLEEVVSLTGLKGRWQVLAESPKIICDTGHNIDGVTAVMEQLKTEQFERLFIVWGMVNDKDLSPILSLLPQSATYLFSQAQVPRAMASSELLAMAEKQGLKGQDCGTVAQAIEQAKAMATEKDLIFIGGSTFVVAEIEQL
ncbi:folylpolyglutamate synthase/dihydrofolate synthase family protein [Persicobacter psychrovividus]|uniref:Dihydrofolate synthase/folylpolyglutamate synthase n=1 Tax=Persicobacter psychrovividus TaxID=387638 RepID=A0ABM7VEK2_9BACT|nr:tetrahydrofolate synthase [Persicobacter psychrovividus]